MSSTKYNIAIQRFTCVYQQLISNLALSVLAHKMYSYKKNTQNLSYTDLRTCTSQVWKCQTLLFRPAKGQNSPIILMKTYILDNLRYFNILIRNTIQHKAQAYVAM